MRQHLKKWRNIFGVWLIAGTLYSLQSWYYRTKFGQDASLLGILPSALSFIVLWSLLTPLILWLAERFRIERRHWLPRVGVHLVFAFVLGIIQQAGYNSVIMWARATPERPFLWERLNQSVLANVDYSMLVYFVVLLVSHALDYYRRFHSEQLKAAQLQAELAAAQLQALKMQLHPHFLFNTLNSIAVLIREEPETAARLLDLLSDLLRQTLANAGKQEIPLREEIEFLRHYLEIEQTRFGDRLTVRLNFDTDTLDARVPNLILQPLVENALRHGIAKRRGPGVIEIQAQRKNGELQLHVHDNGGSYTPKQKQESNGGIGLENTRRRLQTLYGDRAHFELKPVQPTGAVATLIIPFHE